MLVGATRPAAAHGEQIEAEIGVADRLGAGRRRHRFGDQDAAAPGSAHARARSMASADSSSWSCRTRTSETFRRRPAAGRPEIAAKTLHAAGEAGAASRVSARSATGADRTASGAVWARGGRRRRRTRLRRRRCRAGSAWRRAGVQHIFGDQRLRARHQVAIGGVASARPTSRQRRITWSMARVGPEGGEPCGRFAAQQRHGIGKVGVEQRVMLDEIGDRGVAEQGRPEVGERETVVGRASQRASAPRRRAQPARRLDIEPSSPTSAAAGGAPPATRTRRA